MNNEDFFTKIDNEYEIHNEKNDQSTQEENQFIKGLPDWDLEPPFETIRRGGNQ